MNQVNNPEMVMYSSPREYHMALWSKKYCYQKLMDQGFVSYQDKGLSWYKVIEGSIIQTVYLYSNTSFMPFATIGYGCHPLFISAPLPQKVTVPGYGRGDVVMSSLHLPTPLVSDMDCPPMHTKSPGGGSELLDEIVFPQFNQIHTMEEAYWVHREAHRKRIEEHLSKRSWADYNGRVACMNFMDWLIYMEDWDMLKYCDRDLSLSLCIDDRQRKRVKAQRAAIYDGKRDEFMVMLERRKKRFVNSLEKKVGIHI